MDPQGGHGFHHVAIRARDFDRSIAFYKETLGFSEKIGWGEAPERAIMLDTGRGVYLEVFERADAGPSFEGNILHFALRTDDVDGVFERATAAGATVRTPPKHVVIGSDPPTPVRLAFFEGPDGEVIELFQNDLT